MNLSGSPETILNNLFAECPAAREALYNSRAIRAQLLSYQATALFILARRYNRPGMDILEIGTAAGYSASIMAQAAPLAKIVTLNPALHEIPAATENLKAYANVKIEPFASWDYLRDSTGTFDLIFVDGDHKQVALDMPWWDRLRVGGLMLFHDYSPIACAPVYEAVNALASKLATQLDVCVMDDSKIGLAGLYKGGAK